MAIETLNDYNAQSCCCDQTLCPIPVQVCQSKPGTKIGVYFLPFADPGPGEIPRVFEATDPDANTYFEGVMYKYGYTGVGGDGITYGHQWEYLLVDTYTEDPFGGTIIGSTSTGNEYEKLDSETPATCVPWVNYFTFNDPYQIYVEGEPELTNTETESRITETDTSIFNSGFPLSLRECPGPFAPNTDEPFEETSWDLKRISFNGWELTGPATKASTIAAAMAEIPPAWTTHGNSCESSLALHHGFFFFPTPGWPTQESVVPEGGWWDGLGSNIQINISCDVVTARVQYQIPATWSDQVTGLTVPFTGTYFLITYDIIEEPVGWDDTIDDPDYEPPDEEPEGGFPPVPQVPKPGRPARTYYAEDQTLEWTGPGTGEANDPSWFTEWIDIPPPAVPGTRRIVNRRLVCRENWGLGTLPQVWGEAVTLSDP